MRTWAVVTSAAFAGLMAGIAITGSATGSAGTAGATMIEVEEDLALHTGGGETCFLVRGTVVGFDGYEPPWGKAVTVSDAGAQGTMSAVDEGGARGGADGPEPCRAGQRGVIRPRGHR